MVWEAEKFRLTNAISAKPDMPFQPPLCRWREAEQARSHDRGPGAGGQMARTVLAWRVYHSHRAEKKPKSANSLSSFQKGCHLTGLEAADQGQQVLYNTNIPSDSRFCTISIFLPSELESAGQHHSVHYPWVQGAADSPWRTLRVIQL